MGLKLKICGMRNPDNILRVAGHYPDYMGFIFYEKSPRYVGKDFRLPAGLAEGIARVGVFVNEYTEQIIAQGFRHDLAAIQLHGTETPEECAVVRGHGYQVIKVFSVDDAFDFDTTLRYKDSVDYFMFDTKGANYGGNAAAFDWTILRKYDQSVPFFLSGGLSAGNIEGIRFLTDMNIHALDVNSGVEKAPGLKSIQKLEEFHRLFEKIQ